MPQKSHEEELVMKKMGLKEFVYRLFFTREDSLDMLQILFLAVVTVTLMAVWKIVSLMMSGSENVVIEALKTLRWLTALLVVTAVPSWLVPIVAKMRPLKYFEKQKNSTLQHETGDIYGTDSTSTETPS